MVQRFALVRLFVHTPRFLVLDESLDGLDEGIKISGNNEF
jgi:ABC-type uncharacterized transport system fused permease/ATPase subunit